MTSRAGKSPAPLPSNSLLKDLYQRDGLEDATDWYDSNATGYDSLLEHNIGYVAPQRCAALLAAFVPDPAASVLDIGCGTGLVAEHLASLGFTAIDGVDLSKGMLRVAQAKGLYRSLRQHDLNLPIQADDNSWDHAISVGAFSGKYIRAQALDEVIRVVRPGGLFLNCVNETAVEDHGFRDLYRHKQATGEIECLHDRFSEYHNHENIQGHYAVFRVR